MCCACACAHAGALYTRGAVAEVGADVEPTLPKGGHRTSGTEGLVMRVRGDGKMYTCLLTTGV